MREAAHVTCARCVAEGSASRETAAVFAVLERHLCGEGAATTLVATTMLVATTVLVELANGGLLKRCYPT